jgi:hypothetical protein
MSNKVKTFLLWYVSFACFLALFEGFATAAAVPFVTLDKGEISHYRYGDSDFLGAEMIIKDATTWSAFWKKHKNGIQPMPPVPKVNFRNDMVVVALLGYQTSGGWPAIEIKSVSDLSPVSNIAKRNYKIRVVENERPGPLDIITNPYHIVMIRKAGSAMFEHEPMMIAVTYQLTSESSYYEGCVSPCMCPVMIGGEIQGSFDLVEASADQWFKYYDVEAINWVVVNDSEQVIHKINGSGTYKVGGDFALTHEMILTLEIDSQPPVVFSSGLVPGGGDFPVIFITVDKGTLCYDVWMDIVARAVR